VFPGAKKLLIHNLCAAWRSYLFALTQKFLFINFHFANFFSYYFCWNGAFHIFIISQTHSIPFFEPVMHENKIANYFLIVFSLNCVPESKSSEKKCFMASSTPRQLMQWGKKAFNV
jgi:hypothetical protein